MLSEFGSLANSVDNANQVKANQIRSITTGMVLRTWPRRALFWSCMKKKPTGIQDDLSWPMPIVACEYLLTTTMTVYTSTIYNLQSTATINR